MNVSYHSHHGAIQESMHVFVRSGLMVLFEKFPGDPLRLLEIGFGTGLNALLSAREAGLHQRWIRYSGIEKYPLTEAETGQLNYGSLMAQQELFNKIHEAEWEKETDISPYFSLLKLQIALPAALPLQPVHGIYLDAFAPDVQPELWSQAFFEQLYGLLLSGGALLTYSSKSNVRRALTAAGFDVTKIPGPPGKREIVRAWK